MQSVTFVDGHSARRTTLPRNGNVPGDSDDVFVREHVGVLIVTYRSRELCVVLSAEEAQFLCDIPSNLPLRRQ